MTRLLTSLALAALLVLGSGAADAQERERSETDRPIKQTRAQADPDDTVLRTPTGRAPVDIRTAPRARTQAATQRTAPRALGTWDTNYGEMVITRRDDGRFLGTVASHDVQMNGRMKDGKLAGTWYISSMSGLCDTERQGSSHWGKFEFTFSDETESFDGTYTLCGESTEGVPWMGNKR